jgi:hypothetical protein
VIKTKPAVATTFPYAPDVAGLLRRRLLRRGLTRRRHLRAEVGEPERVRDQSIGADAEVHVEPALSGRSVVRAEHVLHDLDARPDPIEVVRGAATASPTP